MRGFAALLYFVGYVLLVGPPRAVDIKVRERTTLGELQNQSIAVVAALEFLFRAALLLITFVVAQEILGTYLYELLRLDQLGMLLLAIGVLHTSVYYVFLVLLTSRVGDCRFRIYRLLRNMIYAVLPGVATIVPVLLWQFDQGDELFSGQLIVDVYFYTTVAMLIAGIIEFFVARRKPLGLDQHLN